MPACDAIKCPKRDTTLKAKAPKACKDADRPCSHMQTLPLSSLFELHNSGRLTIEAAVEATTQALLFLGNTNDILMERRKGVASNRNKDLQESERFHRMSLVKTLAKQHINLV